MKKDEVRIDKMLYLYTAISNNQNQIYKKIDGHRKMKNYVTFTQITTKLSCYEYFMF